MMITQITLQNWKAFTKFTIDFKKGINFITGSNASGKTSILEAICLAFTGKALSVNDPRLLVKRDSTKPTLIKLSFQNDDLGKLIIERSLSKKRRLNSKIYVENGESLAESWDDTTKYIEDLFGIDSVFFERIVYMSEGDIFRFIYNPPEEAIMIQIEEALGIVSTRNLLSQIISYENQYHLEQKNYDKIYSGLKLILSEEKPSFDWKEKYQKLVNEKNLQLQQLKENEMKIWNLNSQITNINEITNEIHNIENKVVHLVHKDKFEANFKKELENKISKNKGKLQKISTNLKELNLKKIRIEEKINSIQEILDLLLTTKKNEVSKCPVCNKTLSVYEQDELVKINKLKIPIKRKELDKIEKNIKNLDKRKDRVENDWVSLKESNSLINNFLIKNNNYWNFNQISYDIENTRKKIHNYEQDKLRINKQINNLENNLDNYKKYVEREEILEKFEELQDREASLISNYKKQSALEILKSSVDRTIEEQREGKLGAIYREITNVWNEFMNEDKTKIRLDKRTVPSLARAEHEFSLSQLSGGEKTVLLTIIRTILCSFFTNVDFMLLDEPLEHLDLINREVMIDFLVESYRKGKINQLLVTTFEESVIRKYGQDPNVSLIII